MHCEACGFDSPESSRFCGLCGARVATSCPACNATVPLGLRFCTACGASVEPEAAPLADALGPAVEAPIAERRRVSVLFVDLEGFTALAEALDPEEVRAFQSRYFDTARAVITRYGGTVEKFIGDAVMAVWGAPIAHEDDADRAVRCAIALLDAVDRLGGVAARTALTARAGITTGEAAVTVGAMGQGMVAGDLVNVAARLQSMAPASGVLVDDATRSLAIAAASYEPMSPLELKGRKAPVVAWRLAAPAPATAAARGSHTGPLAGRDRELRELLSLYDGVVRDRRCRLVSITGIAGIGKSRLAWELYRSLDARPELIAWHAGRAPAYGDEITFAAVGEMVRHRIQAPEGTAPDIARRQLASALVQLVREHDERRWLEPRVAALLGGEPLTDYDRAELFAAWRRFFEHVADTTPAVLVFEDLQWADPALVDFVEHLGAWARHHPILIVTLARPELLDRRPAWGTGTGSFTAMHLERLSDAAMLRLLRKRTPRMPEALERRILEHAGGVPLYAVEVVRMLDDERRADGARSGDRRRVRDGGRGVPRIDVPDSLHGLIAARIDALPAGERRLLMAAAVLGRRFRIEALVAIGAEASSVQARVSALARRELLSVSDDVPDPALAEVAFVQEGVREIAYRTLSRGERRTFHLAAARWLDTVVDDDVTESLAGHLTAAHDLAPDHADAARIARRAVGALRRAASNSLDQHVPQRAVGHLEHALRLTDVLEQRALVLDEAATAATAAGRLDLAEEHLRELVDLQAAGGHRRDAAHARAKLASVLLTAQRNESAVAELESALRAFRDIGRDAANVELAAQLARARVLLGDEPAALDWATRALAAAERLDLPGVAVDLLVTRGTARFRMGDEEGGLGDLRDAIAESRRIGAVPTELRARNNLAWLTVVDDPRATLETAREAVNIATSLGVGELAGQLAEVACAAAVDTGDWAWAIDAADDLMHDATPLANRINLAATTAGIRALRGDREPMSSLRALEPLPDDLDEQIVGGIALGRAWVAFGGGMLGAAIADARTAAAVVLGAERLNALVLAARCELWSADGDAAAATVAEIEALDINGRAASAHVATLRAGLGALGSPTDAVEPFADAAAAWRDLELRGLLALCLADACRLTGSRPSPELNAVLDDLGAVGLRRLIGPVNRRTSRPVP
jgi:class 3 adenylate cyclase/tetratricopeptide (TPR) repeat protein